jgi:histidyl-tRNA synthetase
VREGRLRVGTLGSRESRAEYRERLAAHLRAHEDELSAEVRGRIDSNPLRAFDSDHPGTRAVMESAPRLLHHLDREDREHFEAVCALLERGGVAYEVDDTLVRGLDYYTRTVFEYTSDALGAQSGVGGGGRYDGLVEELGGPRTPGIGWAAGVERVLLAGTEPGAGTGALDLYVGVGNLDESPPDGGQGRGVRSEVREVAFEILRGARSAGLSAQMEMGGRSAKGQRNHAHRVGARFLALVGAERAVLRDMEDGGERELAASEVVHAVLRSLRRLA